MDGLYGCDFDSEPYSNNTHNTFHVRYYPTIDESITEQCVQEKYSPTTTGDDYCTPFGSDEYTLTFQKSNHPLSVEDYRFEETFLSLYNNYFPNANVESFYGLPYNYRDYLFEKFQREGSRIGGNPDFCQTDRRQ